MGDSDDIEPLGGGIKSPKRRIQSKSRAAYDDSVLLSSSAPALTVTTPFKTSTTTTTSATATTTTTGATASTDGPPVRRFVGNQRMALNLGRVAVLSQEGATAAGGSPGGSLTDRPSASTAASGSLTDRPSSGVRGAEAEELLAALSKMNPNMKREQLQVQMQELTSAEIERLLLLHRSGKLSRAIDDTNAAGSSSSSSSSSSASGTPGSSSRAARGGNDYIDLRPASDGPKRKRASTLTHGINILRGNRSSTPSSSSSSSSSTSSASSASLSASTGGIPSSSMLTVSSSPLLKKKRSSGISRLWRSSRTDDTADDDGVDDSNGTGGGGSSSSGGTDSIPLYRSEPGLYGALVFQESPLVERKDKADDSAKYKPRYTTNGFGWTVEVPAAPPVVPEPPESSTAENPIEFREYDSAYYRTYFSTQGTLRVRS